MPTPLVDSDPVDVSARRTCDDEGNVLRTRKYGVMELNDSYSSRSITITKDLPAGLTCVRLCDWADQSCGFYIEISRDRITNHLDNWHGIGAHYKVACKFEGCTDTSEMGNIDCHIETVHYSTSYQCVYCDLLGSRSDAMTRHQKTCTPFESAKLQAARATHRSTRKTRKVFTGYIVPARDAA
ncbi:hypothetical protein DFH29DRAFT_1077739 [Suillus ampliporus]|nr:hypothetical protein DFH29DRAFT_1077739 [Suillus ampliporus]